MLFSSRKATVIDIFMTLCLNISVREDSPKENVNLRFSSYFSLGDTICSRVFPPSRETFELNEKAMLGYCISNNLIPCSGVYYLRGLDDKNPYVMMHVGVVEKG